jgi:hypothetical protein
MDLLDRVHPVAAELLDRVDASLLARGAPADHPIWPLLRRVGALPGEAVAHLAAVAPDGLTDPADELRRHADGYRARADEVPMPAAWRGPAAEAYTARWSALSAHLAGTGPDSLAGRLADTASYLDDVSAWLTRARRALAGTVAECLGSAEAVTLRTASGTAAVVAAATVGAHVLATVAEVVDDGRTIPERWAGRLDELNYRPPAPAPTATTAADLRLG